MEHRPSEHRKESICERMAPNMLKQTAQYLLRVMALVFEPIMYKNTVVFLIAVVWSHGYHVIRLLTTTND